MILVFDFRSNYSIETRFVSQLLVVMSLKSFCLLLYFIRRNNIFTITDLEKLMDPDDETYFYRWSRADLFGRSVWLLWKMEMWRIKNITYKDTRYSSRSSSLTQRGEIWSNVQTRRRDQVIYQLEDRFLQICEVDRRDFIEEYLTKWWRLSFSWSLRRWDFAKIGSISWIF